MLSVSTSYAKCYIILTKFRNVVLYRFVFFVRIPEYRKTVELYSKFLISTPCLYSITKRSVPGGGEDFRLKAEFLTEVFMALFFSLVAPKAK